ncbi:MAG: NAD-dependent isocitrate dehydrogenase [Deltaproteobacteria bacterium]|nr:NAD-dependent isocitrate dehydrogenase [Deltaproteobacteria bacterium]
MSIKVALLKGDGIGPEICQAMMEIFTQLKAPIEWIDVPCGEDTFEKMGSSMPISSIDAIKELKVAIKGPTATPIGGGRKSANVVLRKSLDLYSNVRPAQSIPGVETPFKNVDLIIIRENTEDVYAAIEHTLHPDVWQCLKIITRPGSERICRYAFEMARNLKRKKVTCVHKANIMKLTDGKFLEIFREVAKDFPEIEANDVIVDNVCMQLVSKPQQYDVMVTQNLYGDIISDLCAGLIGGLGVAGGANIGKKAAVFEAVHGTAPDIAGKNMANPTALLLSSAMMLEHLKLFEEAKRLRNSLFKVIQEGKSTTKDLKGSGTTKEFTEAICRNFT